MSALRDVQHELGIEPTALPLRTEDGRQVAADVVHPSDVVETGSRRRAPSVDPEATLLRGTVSGSGRSSPEPSDLDAPVGVSTVARPARRGRFDRSWCVDGAIAAAVVALVAFALVRML